MSNNFFLEGPIQTGKSTLIESVLKDRACCCGGFLTQRVFRNAAGQGIELFGFRLVSRTSEPSAPIEEQLENLFDGYEIKDIRRLGFFRYKKADGSSCIDLSPFLDIGLECIDLKSGQKLMLLDEIGGVELVLDEFRRRLFEILKSDIPTIGVIKLRENAQRIHHADDKCTEEFMRHYDQLHGLLTSGINSSVSYYERSLTGSGGTGMSDLEKTIRERMDSFLDIYCSRNSEK